MEELRGCFTEGFEGELTLEKLKELEWIEVTSTKDFGNIGAVEKEYGLNKYPIIGRIDDFESGLIVIYYQLTKDEVARLEAYDSYPAGSTKFAGGFLSVAML